MFTYSYNVELEAYIFDQEGIVSHSVNVSPPIPVLWEAHYRNIKEIRIDLTLDGFVQCTELLKDLTLVIDVEENQHRAELQNENILYQDCEQRIEA